MHSGDFNRRRRCQRASPRASTPAPGALEVAGGLHQSACVPRCPARTVGVCAQVWSLLRGQLAVSVLDGAGVVLDATGVQLQGALDAHAFYEGPLGAFKDPGTQKLTVAGARARFRCASWLSA